MTRSPDNKLLESLFPLRQQVTFILTDSFTFTQFLLTQKLI